MRATAAAGRPPIKLIILGTWDELGGGPVYVAVRNFEGETR